MNYTTIESVRIFGEPISSSQSVNLTAITTPTPDQELHLARHYKNLPYDYTQRLVSIGFSKEKIQAATDTKGSKFCINLKEENIETPSLLLQRAHKEALHQNLQWIQRSDRLYTAFSFNTTLPVGTDSLIGISKLNSEQTARVTKNSRGSLDGDSATINTLSSINPELTNKITTELFFDLSGTQLLHITAYPGSLAPDFPEPYQSSEEQEYNRRFWESMVFVGE